MALEAQDNPFPYVTLVDTADPSTPAAGTKRLWVDTDDVLKIIDEADVVSTVGGGFSGDAGDIPFTPAGTIAATDVQAAIEEVASEATSTEDPVAVLFGAPATAFEFDTSSLTGLTAIGSPTVEDADTTVPGALFYKDATSSAAWMGRYLASPAAPFTAITKLLGFNPSANFNCAGLIVGVADPATGAFVTNVSTFNTNQKINAEKFTNRTTFSATIGGGIFYPGSPVWLALVVNSTTSIDYYWSMDGWIWRKFISANNPSLTVGSVGLAMKSENAAGAGAAFDYLRLFTSALAFPGA